MTRSRSITLVLSALLGWALCGATMGIGMATTTMENALIIHAIAAPIFFAVISSIYFRRHDSSSPLQTAAITLAVVIGMDFFVVALIINKSFEMFESILGTWIPFALIFASTYVTGLMVARRRNSQAGSKPRRGSSAGDQGC